jgi:hypothetical protein
MLHALLVYLHLIATCAAIGTIVVTDLRLLAKVMGYRVVIPPPQRFETVLITAALIALYITGAALVMMGLAQRPDYLMSNGKLQGKLMLVVVLTINAFALHKMVFPILERSRPVSRWTGGQWVTVAAAVSLSNSTWFLCAFLGIARVWNYAVSPWFVLSLAAAAWGLLFLGVNAVLLLASRDEPKTQPDWIDSMKASMSDWGGLEEPKPALAMVERRRVRRDVQPALRSKAGAPASAAARP